MAVQFDMITCPEWKARKPRHPTVMCKQSIRIIFHHTAGHHRELDGRPEIDSVGEAIQYARDIQAYHMDTNGWNDSGHNFLVCRNGTVLQGRWHTVSAIVAGFMVVSAHCVGQNTNIGIEHEHRGNEKMTPEQREASARLQAWIADKYQRARVLPVGPHKLYNATSCPTNIEADIPGIAAKAQRILEMEGDFL